MGDLSKAFPTAVTPHTVMMSIIWFAIFVGQVGYCVLLVLGRTHRTKDLLVNGVGLRLVFINWIMVIWSILFTLKSWLPSAITLGILFLLTLWVNISLLWYPTSPTHPIDTLFVHVPLRLFMLVLLLSTLPQNIFIALNWVYSPDHPERDYDHRATEAFVTIIITNVLGLIWVLLRGDFFWTAGGAYTMIALMSKRPKPTIVFAILMTFTVLYPLSWLAAMTYYRLTTQKQEREAALAHNTAVAERAQVADTQRAPPPELIDGGDLSAIWSQPQD